MKATCSKCGKEYEIKDGTPAAKFVEAHPDRATCMDCFKSGGSNAKEAVKKAEGKSTSSSKASGKITSEDLRKAYDEVKAAFSDVMDEVHEFVGGWTTTIALSKNR